MKNPKIIRYIVLLRGRFVTVRYYYFIYNMCDVFPAENPRNVTKRKHDTLPEGQIHNEKNE